MGKVTTINPDAGQSLSVVGDTYRILVSGKETGGAYAVIDMLVPTNGGPGPHTHVDYQEAFYIVEGEIEVTNEDGVYIAKAGSFVNIPLNGPVHQFKNKTDHLAHMLCILTPAGMEDMFREIGEPVEAGKFLPPPVMDPEKIKKFGEIAERYGQKLYPPDFFQKK